MNVNLFDVLTSVGNSATIDATLSYMKKVFYGEEITLTGKGSFKLIITCVAKDIVEIHCNPIICAVRSCSRCLSEVECEYELSINRKVNVALNKVYIEDSSETDDISYIEDCNLDIDRLVLDELFTILPLSVLCKEDCKGICKVCGTNLNKSTCDCDQTVPDPRMAVFSDIFKDFNKEV